MMNERLRGQSIRRFRVRTRVRTLVCIAAVLLVVSSCAGTDSSQVASGSQDPLATTPPLAVPPVLRQPGDEPASAIATTVPAQEPTLAPTVTQVPAVATEVPAVAVEPDSTAAAVAPAATEIPAAPTTAAAAPATAVPATSVPATAVPANAVAATAVPATSVPATTPEPAAPAATQVPVQPTGAAIALGDFEVVNLVTRTNQNIAELAPSGPTVLWFWAPH